jgi:hypothetical protein
MKLISTINREQLIDLYLGAEAVKKNKPIPQNYASLDRDDPDALDAWLKANGYKDGVISGFKSWALVELSTDDLSNVAVVTGIFQSGRVLKNLAETPELNRWIPDRNPLPIWYAPLSIGIWDDSFSIILRAPTNDERSEGAKLYVEDGSGRSICYFRYLFQNKAESRMRGHIGFDPDPRSSFLKNQLDGQFADADKYATYEKLIADITK